MGGPAARPRATMTRKEIRTAFISYRRLDTDALAGRLRDRLREALPDWIVFMDVYSITPGVDFRVAVRDALTQSSLFFLLIGRNFLGAGTNRLLEADDTVAYEIKVALDLDLRIIPILVNDATMPRPEDFPLEVRQVVYRSAIDVRHSRFDDDLHHLVQVAAGTPPAKGEAFARGGQKPHANFTQASLRVTKLAMSAACSAPFWRSSSSSSYPR